MIYFKPNTFNKVTGNLIRACSCILREMVKFNGGVAYHTYVNYITSLYLNAFFINEK